MKKSTKIIGTLSLALAMTSAVSPIYASLGREPLIEQSTLTSENETIEVNAPWEEKMNYLSYEGVIKEISDNEGNIFISLVEEGKDEEIKAVFLISNDTMIVDQSTKESIKSSELKVGQKISGYYRKDMPMILIYPPRINPELVIIEDEEGKDFIKHSNFDKELISADNYLKLNISDETSIINQYGKECNKEDLYNEDLVVFYTITTRSIPAQTNPSKIIVLKKQLDEDVINTDTDEVKEDVEIAEIVKADSYIKDEVLMVPLRKIAEHLGYEVEWNNENRSILLIRGNASFTISIGREEYGYNKSLGRFDKTPEINNGKTYIPQSFIENLK